MKKAPLVIVGIAVIALVIIFFPSGSPEPTGRVDGILDPHDGYVIGDVYEGEIIPARDGQLEGMIPKVDFTCSGIVYKIGKDRQDGIHYNVTLIFGILADPEKARYAIEDGRMGKEFADGFKLDQKYFRSHVAAFYARSATDNVRKAVGALKKGDAVRLKGHFVYLKTSNGILTTSLDPAAFKCKYVYLTEVATQDGVYR